MKTVAYELKLYDRLHFGGPIQYMADFSALSSFPCTVYFFRVLQHQLNFINPLWGVSGVQEGVLGLNITHMCFDVLHCLDLGVVQHLAGTILARLLGDPADVLKTGAILQEISAFNTVTGVM